MAIPPAHNRVQFTGTLEQAVGGGSEIFSFGFADSSALSPHALAVALGPAIVAWWESGDASMLGSASISGVVVEAIDAAGHVSNSYRLDVGPVVGGGSPTTHSTVLSIAGTLETGVIDGHGRKVRGRFYPPMGGWQVLGATMVLAVAQEVRDSYKELIQGLNAAGAVISVASTTSGGVVVPVTGVTVDTVVDTQRRRKNGVTVQRTAIAAV